MSEFHALKHAVVMVKRDPQESVFGHDLSLSTKITYGLELAIGTVSSAEEKKPATIMMAMTLETNC